MLRQLLITAGLLLATQAALADEAGKAIFVAGEVQMGEHPLALGAAVQEGELLSTGKNGYLYIQTIDKGLFVLRPNTKARIATYHVDRVNPANTRVKLELISGVARSQSGEAVKLARQNFRFNTPVAAIGVRGTDFTVFTDQNVARVAVISGAVTVSGFGGACSPEGTGPCEGAAARELSAAQRGQLLQIQRGQSAPQLVQGGPLSPDAVAPPRGDEPVGKASGPGGGLTVNEPNLDAQKNASLLASKPAPPVVTPPVVTPPVDNPPVVVEPPVVTPPVVTPPVTVPERQIIWGRYQAVLDKAATLDYVKASQSADTIALNPLFAILRSKTGSDYVLPERGTAGFALAQSEAYVVEDYTQKTTAATLSNGALNVDFGKASFTTSFDLLNQANTYKLQAEGTIGKDGTLYGAGQLVRPSNMDVSGALTSEGAVYLFQSRLDSTHSALGATAWGK